MICAAAIVLAAILFGTSGVAQALGPDSASPVAVGVVRLIIGGIALAAIAAVVAIRRGAAVFPRQRAAWMPATLAGLCMFGYQPLFFAGLHSNGVAIGTVVALGSAPVVAGALSAALGRTLPGTRWFIATALAVVGLSLLAGTDAPGTSLSPIGIALSLGAGCLWAGFTVCARSALEAGWDNLSLIGTASAIAAVIGLCFVPFVRIDWLSTSSGLTLALWLGLAATAIPYALYTAGLRRVTAPTAATLALAEPVVAASLGVVVLHEALTAWRWLGIVSIAASIVLLIVPATRGIRHRGRRPALGCEKGRTHGH